MNESLGTDPREVLGAGLQLPVPDTLETIDEPENDSEPPLTSRREGLPSSFRMRHDKHYVEELISPTISAGTARANDARPGGPGASAAGLDDRRIPQGAAPRASAAAVDLIASRLESVVAHAAISRGRSGSVDMVGRTVQAELQRVSRFARAVAINTRETEPVRRSVMTGEIAAAIRSACSGLTRLNGIDLQVTTDDPAVMVAIERALVVQGIAGTIDALLDLVQAGAEGADESGRITVVLQAARVRPALIVDVECLTLSWRAAAPDRFFENDGQNFAAAPAAGILLSSAAHIAGLHGGRCEVQLQGGVSVRYVFPLEPQRPTTSS